MMLTTDAELQCWIAVMAAADWLAAGVDHSLDPSEVAHDMGNFADSAIKELRERMPDAPDDAGHGCECASRLPGIAQEPRLLDGRILCQHCGDLVETQ